MLPLDSLHKKPYEVLVLGRVQGDASEALRYARMFVMNVFSEAARILAVRVTHSKYNVLSQRLLSASSFG